MSIAVGQVGLDSGCRRAHLAPQKPQACRSKTRRDATAVSRLWVCQAAVQVILTVLL
jgi:hypothetical protein